jgi:hypothetical protein
VSNLSISVSVEGLDLSAWEGEFKSALSQAPANLGLTVSQVGGAAGLGARRSGAVKVKGATVAGGDPLDTAVKVLGVVISALSLAVASANLDLNREAKAQPVPAPGPTFVCTIEGPQGATQLLVTGAAIPSEHVLRACLNTTGMPTKIKAAPKRGS